MLPPERKSYIFDSEGKLITDPIGRVLRYTYDGDLLTQVTYPNGGSFQYNHDESGLILSVRDLNGKTYVKNTYDRDSRVTRQEMINGRRCFSHRSCR